MNQFLCPKCKSPFSGVFPKECPNCKFNIHGLAGKTTSEFQRKKLREHTDLLYGSQIQTYGKEFNTSFDFVGYAALEDIVRFDITYGEHTSVLSQHGNHQTEVIVCYLPAIIGSGVSVYSASPVPCSGIAIMSPGSANFGHPFPTMDDWVRTLNVGSSVCKVCSAPTPFACPVCERCYLERQYDWRKLLDSPP